MSAVDEYREARGGSFYTVTALVITMKADAAIAELETELKKAQLEISRLDDNITELEAALTDRQEAYTALHKRWTEAEAELAVLKHNMNAGTPGHALGYDCELETRILKKELAELRQHYNIREKAKEAELAKTKWMLNEACAYVAVHTVSDGPTFDDCDVAEIMADLERRWAERETG